MTSENGPVVSVVVLGWNGREYVEGCLGSVMDQDFQPPYEVLFVDNGSTDGTPDLASAYPGVNVHRLDRNYGYCVGNNIGFDRSAGRYVVFLNQDVVVHRSWLRELVAALESDAAIQAAHANVIQPWYREFAAMERTVPINAAYTADLTPLGYIHYKSITTDVATLDTMFLHGTSLIVRRELIEELGYAFDPDMFAYGEDVDLALRVRAAGYRTVVATRATVYHKHVLDSGLSVRAFQKTVRAIRNRLIAFWKCSTWPEFVPLAVATLVGSPFNAGEFGLPVWRRALYFFLLLPPTAVAVFAAPLSMPRYRARRRQILAARRVPPWWLVRTILFSRSHLCHSIRQGTPGGGP